ncbi:MAG: hypothetical protein MUC51_05795 [Anaerolineae bacterium]|nr:hypothetical protein [Anaerolineae bacterium]
MIRLSRLILVFAALSLVLFLGPALLSQQFGPNPLLRNGDLFDLLTPLVLIPLYWLLFQIRRDLTPNQREMVAFLILAALWVMGHGMHLAANSISHLMDEMKHSDAYMLTHFYDETLSHYLWHAGMVGLSALLLYRQWRNPFPGSAPTTRLNVTAGLIYGAMFFGVIVEGGTTPLGIPFAVLVSLFGLAAGRRHWKTQPLLLFFLVSALLSLGLFAAWAIYWGGLPQFSELGIIK